MNTYCFIKTFDDCKSLPHKFCIIKTDLVEQMAFTDFGEIRETLDLFVHLHWELTDLGISFLYGLGEIGCQNRKLLLNFKQNECMSDHMITMFVMQW